MYKRRVYVEELQAGAPLCSGGDVWEEFPLECCRMPLRCAWQAVRRFEACYL